MCGCGILGENKLPSAAWVPDCVCIRSDVTSFIVLACFGVSRSGSATYAMTTMMMMIES